MKEEILKALQSVSNPKKAKDLQWFFKTGKGEYGEGDIFVGIVVPDLRKICKQYYKNIQLKDLDTFITSPIHEYRLFALLTMTYMYEKADEDFKKQIYTYYIDHTQYINNWDLVDLSAPNIVGKYLKEKDRSILYTLAKSKNMWEQRVSVLATFTYIKEKDFKDALAIAKILLHHEHDLIHKAVGWMLREIGKKDLETEEKFLGKYYKTMPRTMLRYAIEKFEETKRKSYLNGTI